MKNNSIRFVFFILSGILSVPAYGQMRIDYKNFLNVKLDTIVYDTLEGDFFYENIVFAYSSSDAIVKSGHYIQCNHDIKTSYYKGYYILNSSHGKMICSNNSFLKRDFVSVDSFERQQLYEKEIAETRAFEYYNSYNPFCGVYYKKYKLRIEVVKIGLVKQRLPFFENCDRMKKRGRKVYKIDYLPTYLVTDVFHYNLYEP
jgi:hypothetical protein